MPEIKRHTAQKTLIEQVLNAKYIQQQDLEPNYLEINKQKAMRLNIIATIVSKQQNNLIIDDGTGSINTIIFNQEHNDLNVGETVLLIGRPREHENKRYIVIEIIKKIDKKWYEHRRKELKNTAQKQITKKQTETKNQIEETKTEPIKLEESENHSLKILSLIRQLDTGEGAPIQQIIQQLNIQNAEQQIQILINEGEIYEIKPGKIKILWTPIFFYKIKQRKKSIFQQIFL